jgi:hypothetical protein
MGLDRNGVKLLLYGRDCGVDYTTSIMIGRQELHLSPADMARILKSWRLAPTEADIARIFSASGAFADEFLRYLGASEVDALDYSDHEGANRIHDMNLPIPDELKGRYSAVIDGGSLEHIFNFPTAVRNCMEMVKVGGHFLSVTPANNFMGHGFYQFSPELFFRILAPENGFEPPKVIAVENRRHAGWYLAKNPETIGRRVTYTNSTPTYLLVLARKLAEAEIFHTPPQQSDYVSGWSRAQGRRHRWSDSALSRKLYKPVERGAKKIIRLFVSGFSPRFFEPLDPRPRP